MLQAAGHLGAHPVRALLSFPDVTGAAAAAHVRGAGNSHGRWEWAPGALPSGGGHPATPTTTEYLICILNASQMIHFWSLQLLPTKTISPNGAEILDF